jgi:hypothetical protein
MCKPQIKLLAVTATLLGFLIFPLFRSTSSAELLWAGTIPPDPPILNNTDFECTTGYYSTTNAVSKTIYVPNDWQLLISQGAPKTQSARVNFARSCEGSAHVERIYGIDSLLVEAQDLETPPTPGKPFDVSFYQQISATVGGAYSLSGWLLSLCGGSNVPNDCPAGNYIAKMLGIDPTGGTDPLASSVVWGENRRNFVENNQKVGWTNVRTVAVAQAPTITVFARLNSPFQWHGNHAFIDALGLVRAPTSQLTVPATVSGTQVITVVWSGEQSPDVLNIPGGQYRLLFDLEYRVQEATAWQNFVDGAVGAGSRQFQAGCTHASYEFRIRARAEQPDGQGVQPNQRYPGIWSEPQTVIFNPITTLPDQPAGPVNLYLPLVRSNLTC